MVAFAVVGVLATAFLIRNLTKENQLETAYLRNCDSLKIGMTTDEVKSTMRQGLEIDFRGFDYEVLSDSKGIINVTMNYSVDGGSYIIRIEIDNVTGLVKSFNCPEKK
jgi:hypothetical protein